TGVPTDIALDAEPGEHRKVLAPLRAQALLLVLPNYLGISAVTPKANETVDAYLRHTANDARRTEDWALLARCLEAKEKIAASADVPANPDSAAIREFLSAENHRDAGQYALAVAA